jgi:hypothetical protein
MLEVNLLVISSYIIPFLSGLFQSFLNDYLDYEETHYGLSEYFTFCNEKRKHQSLNYKAPAQIYFAK